MSIDDVLNKLEAKYLDKGFWYAINLELLKQGKLSDKRRDNLQEQIKRIKDDIALELANQANTEDEAKKLLLDRVRRINIPLFRPILVMIGMAKKPKLNAHEASGLWLGFCRDQSYATGAGLWQIYVDLLDTTTTKPSHLNRPKGMVPPIINDVFKPTGQDGENETYVDRKIKRAKAKMGFDLDAKRYGDATKVMAWIIETELPRRRRRNPLNIVDDLRLPQHESKAVNCVNADLSRSGDILTAEFIRRAYVILDNCEVEDE